VSEPAVAPYPWDRLDRVPRSAVRRARHIRHALPSRVSADTFGSALGVLLTSDVSITVRAITPAAFAGAPHGAHLEGDVTGVRVVVDPEPALLAAALSRLLGRGVPLTTEAAELDPALRGALAAVCVEVARRSAGALVLRATMARPPVADGLRIDVRVVLDGTPYRSTVWLFADASPTSGESALELELLGAFPITVPLVAAVSEAPRSEVQALRAGDVWLPGDGWLHRGVEAAEWPGDPVLSRAALATPMLERGVETGRTDDRGIMIRGAIIALSAARGQPASGGDGPMSETSETSETLRDIALEAPVVVRVEVASVTLTAREWAKLGPGDVLETGVRLSTPVVLRVGGSEVARGELVSVDGELGVRIREIVDPGRAP